MSDRVRELEDEACEGRSHGEAVLVLARRCAMLEAERDEARASRDNLIVALNQMIGVLTALSSTEGKS